MNKAEVIDFIASKADLNKASAERALNAFIECVEATGAKQETVSLPGFGTFKVSYREARKGRNPQTGAEILIPAGFHPSFKAGKGYKDAVKKS